MRYLTLALLLLSACKLDTTSPMIEKGTAPPPPYERSKKPQAGVIQQKEEKLKLAAELGQKEAMYQLGMLNQEANVDVATFWLCKAWKAGDARAAYGIGQTYAQDTPKQDLSLALAYAQLARDLGITEAETTRKMLVAKLDSTTLSRGITYAMKAPNIPCESGKKPAFLAADQKTEIPSSLSKSYHEEVLSREEALQHEIQKHAKPEPLSNINPASGV